GATRAGSDRRPRGGPAAWRARSRAEELDEALLDLRVLLLELLGIHGEKLELAHLRLVRGVFHVRMPGVEAFAVGHRLLDLAREGEIVEELRGVRMRREAGDRLRRHDERHAFLRIDDLDRITLLLELVRAVISAVDGDDALAGRDDGGRVVRRLH